MTRIKKITSDGLVFASRMSSSHIDELWFAGSSEAGGKKFKHHIYQTTNHARSSETIKTDLMWDPAPRGPFLSARGILGNGILGYEYIDVSNQEAVKTRAGQSPTEERFSGH